MTDSEEQSSTRPLRDVAVAYLKGVAMGAADTVPGVSGGTIALIVGIYERLITALTALDPRVLTALPSLHRGATRRQFLADLREMDIPFLFSLGLGMVSAVVVLSRLLDRALTTIPGPTYAFFFGLIAASAVVLFDRTWFRSSSRIGAALAGFTLAFLISDPGVQGALPNSLLVVFVAGSVAISGMVLPGISGAFILLLLGQYEYLVDVLTEFTDELLALPAGGASSRLAATATVVAVFLMGALLGLFTVAYAVRWALSRYRTATFVFLVSLMVGALRLPLTEILVSTDQWTPAATAGILGAGLVGSVLVLGVNAATEDIGYD